MIAVPEGRLRAPSAAGAVGLGAVGSVAGATAEAASSDDYCE